MVILTTLLVVRAQADNFCPEYGPHISNLSSLQPGTLTPGYVLVPTNVSAVIGQPVIQPTISNLSITNGLERYYETHDCPQNQFGDGWKTSSIPYTFGSLYFIPTYPQILWNPGIYYYTGKVVATCSPFTPLTNTLGTVTVNVATNTADVLFDIDFSKNSSSTKTGYAAIGNGNADYWNSYAATGSVSGSLTNLKTVEGYVSPVGMLVTNLSAVGTNGSSDAMYKDYFYTNSATATVTFTNLPAGTWSVYLYSQDGNFTLTAGGSYGTQTCYDGSPNASPVTWQAGRQYVAFQNVTVITNGQRLAITINPGTNGAARISGLQIVSTNHLSSPYLPGMVSWWRAENNALDSISTNNGTVIGNTSYTNTITGTGFKFGAIGDRVTTPTGGLPIGTADRTIEGWVYNTAFLSGGDSIFATYGNPGYNGQVYAFGAIGSSHLFFFSQWGLVITGPSLATGLWYHVAVTSVGTNNIKLYLNGTNVASGSLSFNTPAGSMLTIGSIDPPYNSSRQMLGMVDELSIYNRALSAAEIGTIYTNGVNGKFASVTQDSDYDGVSDVKELAARTDPNDANSVPQLCLGYWPFDANTWVGSAGQLPLSATNIVSVPSWDANAALIDNTNIATLKYRDVETNGNANINLRNGTIRFWFKPDWSSTNAGGTGPQSEGRFIEMGSKGSTNGWWGLLVGTAGTNIYFGTQTNSTTTLTTNLSAAISWSSNIWHQVVLTYNATNTSLYADGQPVMTNGVGVAYYPGPAVRVNGFTIGSSALGTSQARGVFDDLYTFNYPLSAADIFANYQADTALDSDGDGVSNILENQRGSDPYSPNLKVIITTPRNGSTIP